MPVCVGETAVSIITLEVFYMHPKIKTSNDSKQNQIGSNAAPCLDMCACVCVSVAVCLRAQRKAATKQVRK